MGGEKKMATKFACFTAEQQAAYERLTPAQQRYILCRSQGYNKAESWRLTGYKGKRAAQVAALLERDNAIVKELADIVVQDRRLKNFTDGEGDLNDTAVMLAKQKGVEKAIRAIEGADSETAKRIVFYREIISGKIKTVKIKKRFNKAGELVERIVEETSDIAVRMQARKELDRLLGLNSVMEMDKLQVGSITVNIVDASRQEALADSRNNVDLTLDIDKYQVVDGEETVVVAEESETVDDSDTPKSKFFDTVGEEE